MDEFEKHLLCKQQINTMSHEQSSVDFAERVKLLQRIQELEEENARLKKMLGVEKELLDSPTLTKNEVIPAMQRLTPEEKVALFRSLFCCREDVFARRWYSATTGKSGYQPVCRNEWNPQLCDKKKTKCADCPNRQFLPLSYNDVYRHLAGKDADGRDVIGMYAINSDNKCNFLCTDFDDKNCEHGYRDDVGAFVDVCKCWDVPCYVERSRSGNGAHVWIFFETPIPAMKARLLGNSILTEAMNRNGRISFKSYDRFFPNQDTLPEGGLGNLVALPLQGNARKMGNSVFVDNNFAPFTDQWNVLLNVKRLQEEDIDNLLKINSNEKLLGTLSTTSENKPWEVPVAPKITNKDFSTTISITRANMLYLPLSQLSPKVLNHLKRMASFRNPEFYSRQAMRLSTYSTPRIISCAEITDDYLALPRGCEEAVVDFLKEKNVNFNIEDSTNCGQPISVQFSGELRENQQNAIYELTQYNTGVLSATTAFGKTITAIGIIAERKVNTLVLVHTKALLDQWKRNLETFLKIDDLPEMPLAKRGRKRVVSAIGTLSSEGNKLHGIIDIALMQSCVSNDDVKPFVRDYGLVIADECHHVSAVNFERILKTTNAKYVYGLTATPIRKDGLQPIIFMQCGSIRYSTDAKLQMQNQTFERLLVPRFTSCHTLANDKQTYAQTIQELSENEFRNQLIVNDVHNALQEKRSPIVLTNRTSHVEVLAKRISCFCKNVVTLVGSESAKEKRAKLAYLQSISPSESLVIVATGKYVGEGFDCPRLDALFLALPVSWKGIVAQYAGRLHRDYAGKHEVLIYDYIDIRIPLCDVMYRRRLKGYAAIGYKIRSDELLAEMQPTNNLIYNGKTFVKPFMTDVSTCKRSIVIFSTKVSFKPQSIIADLLVEQALKGREIVVCTREHNTHTVWLQNRGIRVQINGKLTLCASVIDNYAVWYGSVNILGFHSTEDNLICFQNAEIAQELVDVLYK